MVVDRAIECVQPGFDGGTTTIEEARESMAEYRRMMDEAMVRGGR